MSFNIGAASVTMKMPQAKARSVICFETREIGNGRYFELSRRQAGWKKADHGAVLSARILDAEMASVVSSSTIRSTA